MRSLLFIFREFIHSLAQNRFLHFTYGAQVAVSLLVLGIFFLLLVGALSMWAKLGDSLAVHIFLSDEISAQRNLELERELETHALVASVDYRSKEDASQYMASHYEQFTLPEDLENPYPASYAVHVKNPRDIEKLALQYEGADGVLAVRYASNLVAKYIRVLTVLGIICLATMSLLVVFTYSSINNIIKLSVYARRAEIRIMQLVGATWWFIRWPFLFEGLFFGVTGALAAILILWALLTTMGEVMRISKLALAVPGVGVSTEGLLLGMMVVLLCLGAIVGFVGSLKAVNSFLARETAIAIDAAKIKQMMG